MVLVEMVFDGEGGLGQWVDEAAADAQATLSQHGMTWKPEYPLTLRDTLRLGLQHQVAGSRARPAATTRGHQAYRVWLQLPDGGLRAWTAQIASCLAAGCKSKQGQDMAGLRQELQLGLVHRLGRCLRRPAAAPAPALAAAQA